MTEPREIKEYLDRTVVGHEAAKRTVAIAFSNYVASMTADGDAVPKESILLIGNTGIGKTFIFEKLAELAGIPMSRTTASGKSAEGYYGENLSSVFYRLCRESEETDPFAVVFIDELDKLVKGRNSYYSDALQDELIAYMEESELMLGKDRVPFNTRNLLFVAAGAFQGPNSGISLEGIVADRLGGNSMGFKTNTESPDNPLQFVTPDDLIRYGLKPELASRFTSLVALNALTNDELFRILTESDDSILTQYLNLMARKGYTVTGIKNEIPRMLVEHSDPTRGARGLRSVCKQLFDPLFYSPKKFTHGSRMIRLTPKLVKRILAGDFKEHIELGSR